MGHNLRGCKTLVRDLRTRRRLPEDQRAPPHQRNLPMCRLDRMVGPAVAQGRGLRWKPRSTPAQSRMREGPTGPQEARDRVVDARCQRAPPPLAERLETVPAAELAPLTAH